MAPATSSQVLHLNGPCNAPYFRACVESVLRALALESPATEGALRCEWIDGAQLPTSVESSLGYALVRLEAVMHSALAEPSSPVRPATWALLHQYDEQQCLFALVSPAVTLCDTVGESFVHLVMALYSTVVHEPCSATPGADLTTALTQRRRAVDSDVALWVERHGSLAPLISAYAIVLSLLSGTTQIAIDVALPAWSGDGCGGLLSIALELRRNAALREVLAAACVELERAPDTRLEAPRSRAGLVVAADAPITNIVGGGMTASLLPIPHFASWAFRLTWHDAVCSAISIDAFFAPPTVVSLYLHVLRCLFTNADASMAEVTRLT